MVKINIVFPSYGESRSLENTIKKQIALFCKKNSPITEADVKLKHGPGVTGDKICEIYLKVSDKNVFTTQTAASFESALTKAVNKLQNQLDAVSSKTA